jgi:hypothetical protein
MRNYQNKNNKIHNYNIKMINNKKNKNKKNNNIKSSRSLKNNNRINNNNLRYLKTTQSFENKKKRNKSSSTKNKEISKAKKKSKGLRIIKIPNNIVESEINLVLKNKIINIPKNYSPVKNKLINIDNSKYEKINKEQMKYNIIKEYSNTKPNKEKGFLNRMQFIL